MQTPQPMPLWTQPVEPSLPLAGCTKASPAVAKGEPRGDALEEAGRKAALAQLI